MILLEQNATGPWVWEAQRLLIRAGLLQKANGFFDAPMLQIIKRFQQLHQLPVTEKLDDATWKALGWTGYSTEKNLTNTDIHAVATQLGVDVPMIKAVFEVESRGSGFLPDGRPKILFEGHIFWAELKRRGKDPMEFAKSNGDILYPKWTKAYYKGNALEYDRLSRAKSIDHDAALASASWGTFQIMGFNYKACGYTSLATYLDSCYVSEGEHLKAFAAFITTGKLISHLKAKNWAAFAKGYNGPGYKQNNYDVKLADAYTKHLKASA